MNNIEMARFLEIEIAEFLTDRGFILGKDFSFKPDGFILSNDAKMALDSLPHWKRLLIDLQWKFTFHPNAPVGGTDA